MIVSLSNALTTIAVVWFSVIGLCCLCEDNEDTDNVVCCFMILGSLFFAAILWYRIGSLIFSIIGG